jgi:prepilin-type N-terminal cleavage/methylation domain-containing protein
VRIRRDESGFTLLEVMIAVAIMLVAFSSILMVESASINTSAKAKQMNVVGMLAKRAMIDAELEFQNKPFADLKKEESGVFKDPHQDYQWKRAVKEVKFPELNMGGSKKEGAAANSGDGGEDRGTEILTRLLTKFLSNAVREVTVTVTWKKGTGTQNFTVSTYWVDLNSEFALSE